MITGTVDRKHKAREQFERAVAEGKTAALLEQNRDDIFTQEIGNLPAGETLIARITVDQKLAWLPEGEWELRFPTVIGPRYISATDATKQDAHDTSTWIGSDRDALTSAMQEVVPDYMTMGASGMAEMGEMEMPLPDNTLPMMTGWAQFGPVEMGGMFSVVKVREGLASDDYADPGDYEHPPGTVSYEWTGDEPVTDAPEQVSTEPRLEVQVVKPAVDASHNSH